LDSDKEDLRALLIVKTVHRRYTQRLTCIAAHATRLTCHFSVKFTRDIWPKGCRSIVGGYSKHSLV
jgi:hypothetical protein